MLNLCDTYIYSYFKMLHIPILAYIPLF